MDMGQLTQLSLDKMPKRASWLRAGKRWPTADRHFQARRTMLVDLSHTAEAKRIKRIIRDRLDYDMALVCGSFRLEYVYLSSGWPHYRLYRSRKLVGIVDVPFGGPLCQIQERLAGYLAGVGFKAECCKLVQVRRRLDAVKHGLPRLF